MKPIAVPSRKIGPTGDTLFWKATSIASSSVLGKDGDAGRERLFQCALDLFNPVAGAHLDDPKFDISKLAVGQRTRREVPQEIPVAHDDGAVGREVRSERKCADHADSCEAKAPSSFQHRRHP